LLSLAIFGSIAAAVGTPVAGLDAVKMPYIILCIAFLLFALLLAVSKLPPITRDEHVEHSMGAFKYPQLVWGMIAIFVYVGVEVTIQSNLPELMKQSYILGMDSSQTVHFISLYWGSLMIGRWVGALTVFNLSKTKKRILTVVVPLIAYAVILLVNYIKLNAANDLGKMNDLYGYFPFVFILIGGFFLAQEKPARTMILFGSMAGIMMIIGLLTTGKVALYSFMSGGLFCSVMWPCIFSLSIAGLGKFTTQGSSMLIMMILGGAIIPPLQGYIADLSNIHISYVVPVFCFAYLAFYGWKTQQVLKAQGIDYDAGVSAEAEVLSSETAEKAGVLRSEI
jgi:MFS transporter, FHS family, L-fucose permease